MTIDLTNFQPIYSGADGVFDINKTSGCITLKVYPADLRREVFNIKVKVNSISISIVFCCILFYAISS